MLGAAMGAANAPVARGGSAIGRTGLGSAGRGGGGGGGGAGGAATNASIVGTTGGSWSVDSKSGMPMTHRITAL